MNPMSLSKRRVRQLLQQVATRRVVVVGDVMLDQFIWGQVQRISPEAPVPVVDFERESFMPGGAANVARNLSALGLHSVLFSVVGRDEAAERLQKLLVTEGVSCRGLIGTAQRDTSIKTRIVAHNQQVVRVDRETKSEIDPPTSRRLMKALLPALTAADAVVVGDYGKGVVTQELLEWLKDHCRAKGIWLSMDPKPVHRLNLSHLSLVTPNRKEAFALAGIDDKPRKGNPMEDAGLLRVIDKLLGELRPALLLITLGDQGMILCQNGQRPIHIPTLAQDVYDVSGAGDTVIASFTMAIVAGASPKEAAVLSNHAAGLVVGKVGTATVSPSELLASFV